MSFPWVVQTAIYSALNNSVSCQVYDVAPQNSDFPYITIGQATAIVNDTDTTVSQQFEYTIHVWTEGNESSKECKLLQGEVFDALYLIKFSETGYKFTKNTFLNSDSFVDSDGVTRHGIQDFKLTIERV